MRKITILLIIVVFSGCAPSEGAIQTAIAQTQSAYTPTPPKATYEILEEEWRIPFPADSVYPIFDIEAKKEYADIIIDRAKGLGIDEPFRWEIYSHIGNYDIVELMDYYSNYGKIRRFATRRYEYFDGDKAGVVQLVKSPQIITVEFWTYDIDQDPELLTMVIYKNFE